MPALFRKIIITFAIIVLILFISLVIAAWTLGAFSSVKTQTSEKGPYYFITLDSISTYRDVPVKIEIIKKLLAESGHEEDISGTLVFSDPMRTPLSELSALGGFIRSDSLSVPAPLKIRKIKKRSVVTATIEANPSIATFKTYPALAEWLRKNERQFEFRLPFLEVYHKDGSVTVEMPVSLKTSD